MIDHEFTVSNSINAGALDAALRAVISTGIIGVSTYGPAQPIRVFTDDEITREQVEPVVLAHDPVFLSADKLTINADGVDLATITVQAPKDGAAAVTLAVNGYEADVIFADGVGLVQTGSLDPMSFTVSVQDGANRCGDTITIKAV